LNFFSSSNLDDSIYFLSLVDAYFFVFLPCYGIRMSFLGSAEWPIIFLPPILGRLPLLPFWPLAGPSPTPRQVSEIDLETKSHDGIFFIPISIIGFNLLLSQSHSVGIFSVAPLPTTLKGSPPPRLSPKSKTASIFSSPHHVSRHHQDLTMRLNFAKVTILRHVPPLLFISTPSLQRAGKLFLAS